jgi:membrane-associated phospholipid phosphatase
LQVKRMDEQLLETGQRSLPGILLITGALMATLLIFVFISISKKNNKLDNKVFEWATVHTNERNNRLMLFFTALGGHKFFIPVNLALLAYFLFIKNNEYALKIPVIAISSLGLMFLLKYFFYRTRPDNPLLKQVRGLSYPSGHALMSVSFYGLLIHIVWHNVSDQLLKWLLIFLLLMLIQVIGLSRVYLRVHYATDVLAGYAIGFIWLMICLYFLPENTSLLNSVLGFIIIKKGNPSRS